MKAGIVVDDWKLPVFRRRLDAAGYTYTDGGALVPDTTNLMVETTDILALKAVVEACQDECRRNGRPK